MDSGLLVHWSVAYLVIFICLAVVTYVVKTKGIGVPLWGLAIAIALLCVFIPLVVISSVVELVPSLALSLFGQNFEAASVPILAGTVGKKATLDQTYFVIALFFLLLAIGQSYFAAWLLYVRHNRYGLRRAVRIMWSSGLMFVLAVGVLPMLLLGKQGLGTVQGTVLHMGIYIVVLLLITAYIYLCPLVRIYYPKGQIRKSTSKIEGLNL